ncbi:MAG: hypothetical protein ACRD2Z_13655 [Thermoanaerobaculia bacterium]
MFRATLWSAALLLGAILTAPAAAQDIGFHGWGPRVGLSADPDQITAGFHFNLGEFVRNLRFQPAVEVGFGDDRTLIQATIPVLYRFDVPGNFTPYAGGGLGVAWVDFDDDPPGPPGRRDDSDVDAAPVGIGGIEWPLRGGNDIFLELNISRGDLPDVKVLVGWQFGA